MPKQVGGKTYLSPKENFLMKVEEVISQKQGLVVEIQYASIPKPEMTVIPPENVALRKLYYNQMFDDELKHKEKEGIRIVRYTAMEVKK